MRTRTLLASLLLAFVGLVALAPAASAQGEEGGEEQLSEDTLECIHLAEEADDPEACQEAPNPILPATDEIVWGSISFAALLFLLYKFGYPQVKKMLDDRTERIRSDLQAADGARAEAERSRQQREDFERRFTDIRIRHRNAPTQPAPTP